MEKTDNTSNDVPEEEQRWGSKSVEGSGRTSAAINIQELRTNVVEDDAESKRGYGGKFGVQADRMDKEMSYVTLLKDCITVAQKMLSIEDLNSCLVFFDNAVLCNFLDDIFLKDRMELFTAAILNRNYKFIEEIISETGSRQIICIILNMCPYAFSSIAQTIAQITKMMQNGKAVFIYQCDDAEETVMSTMSHLETELPIFAKTSLTSDFSSHELQHLGFKILSESTIPCFTNLDSFYENNDFNSKYGHLFSSCRNWDKMYIFLRRSLGFNESDLVFQHNWKIICIES